MEGYGNVQQASWKLLVVLGFFRSKCSRSVHYNEASMSLHAGIMDTSVSPRFCDVAEVAYSHLCAVANELKLASNS